MGKLGLLSSIIIGVLCLSSCGIFFKSEFGSTSFSNDSISLGQSKEEIIAKYGKPYTQELEYADGKTVETIGYKEHLYYGYKINTYFVFEDGKLVRKLQVEDKPNKATFEIEND